MFYRQETRRGSTSAPSPTPEKKLTNLHDLQKWAEHMWGVDVGLVPPIGAATDRHQTDQSRFYLCCGYTGVGVHFVQRIVTSNMTEIFVDS